jgi:flavin reductase (DIM6/NTAB) family NADH-FMN oxidoreductase RutF
VESLSLFYETAKGHGLPRDPFKAIVAPRPIGWISTRSLSGAINLAPYSFYNAVSSNPHLVWFASEGEKDSVTFARESGEFVVNLVGRDLAEKMNASSVDAPRGESEFGYAGLTTAPCRLVAAPRVAEAPAAMECKLTEIYEPKGLDGRPAGVLVVMGEVVGIHIDEAVLKNGYFDVTRAGNVARLGYRDYLSIDKIFTMVRPRWKAD